MDDIKLRKYFLFYLLFLLLFIIVYFVRENFYVEMAKQYAKNKNNIVNGCLILKKNFSDKNSFMDYEVEVGGNSFILRHAVIKEFPFAHKYYYFKQELGDDNVCYRIDYVKVNFLFLERIYIYDLI
ncbi:hypothetical protein [Acinetobacter piscicola]|uniref:hypothetical protein n=1 Tax=Acinetobacter piscicola TaxID=2006115 RepID=UPI000B7C9C81|nr:hypothetical protein [Acinetobacter piscicola]